MEQMPQQRFERNDNSREDLPNAQGLRETMAQPRTENSLTANRQRPRVAGQPVGTQGPGQNPARKNEQDKSMDALLMRLEEQLVEAKKVPFSENCMIDRDEALFIVKMIREGLPGELREAKWLLQQNRQLIAAARKEAENIMHNAEQQMARMIDEHEITQQAQAEAKRIMDEANAQSRQIHKNSIDFAKEKLVDLEEQLTDMLVFIQKNKKDLDL